MCLCLYSVKAILCFLGQRVKLLGPNSRLSGVVIWKNYLNSQQSSVSWSIKKSAAGELPVHKVSKVR